jgi:DNA-directed RNA polymerase subunit RPC12/RpoP
MIYECRSCKHENDITDEELDSGDHFDCEECCERNWLIGTKTVDAQEYYESCCESAEAARYEEAAYGNDRDEYYPSDTHTFHEREDY